MCHPEVPETWERVHGFPVPQPTIMHPPARPIDLAEKLRGPVLAFWGDQDEAVSVEHARAYSKLAASYNGQFRGEMLIRNQL